MLFMSKQRGQIRINFSAAFKEAFDQQCEAEELKPAQLATKVLSWYLQQPQFMKSLVRYGLTGVPEPAREATARAITEHLLGAPRQKKTA